MSKVIYGVELDALLTMNKNVADILNISVSDATNISNEEETYISNSVNNKILRLKDKYADDFIIVLYSHRTLDEYKKLKFDFEPDYAILSSGAVILHKGEIDKAYNKYVSGLYKKSELLEIKADIDEFDSIKLWDDIQMTSEHSLKMYIRDIKDWQVFDTEVMYVQAKHINFDIVRENYYAYMYPKFASKQAAFRWITKNYSVVKVVASGYNETDLGVLTLANEAYACTQGNLIKLGYIQSSRRINYGLNNQIPVLNSVNKMLKD